MLAYVFWHRRRDDVPRDAYEAMLARFHARLREAAPEGFLGSAMLRAPALGWMKGGETYEDWYLLHNGAALDALNLGAYHGITRTPHDEAAGAVAAGKAGVYQLRRPSDDLAPSDALPLGAATWFDKAAGESYDAFFADMDERLGAQQVLWSRFMVLGPAAEMTIRSTTPVAIEDRAGSAIDYAVVIPFGHPG